MNQYGRTFKGNFKDGIGNLYKKDIKEDYFNLFKNTLHFGDRRLKVVIDCGNGVTSLYAKELYSMFNIDLISICDVSDGHFPSHHPDPVVEENLVMLKEKVKKITRPVNSGLVSFYVRMSVENEMKNLTKKLPRQQT